MEKILVSACLLGDPVRYDGAAKPCGNAHLARWRGEGRLVSYCPEIAGGFAIPRLPAEIEAGITASDVLAGQGRLRPSDKPIAQILPIAVDNSALPGQHAILTDGSPSCGTGFVYSGHFDGGRIEGQGVTTALLQRNGIKVWSQTQIDALAGILSLK